MKILPYLRYSNFTVTVRLNPFSWDFIPYFGIHNIWPWPDNSDNYALSWLFLSFGLSIDDGSW